jgi:hypothetical protein
VELKWIDLITYQGTGLQSKKNPSVGPLSGSVAAHTIPFAPSSTGRPPRPHICSWPPIQDEQN